jgi:hypothetical protein
VYVTYQRGVTQINTDHEETLDESETSSTPSRHPPRSLLAVRSESCLCGRCPSRWHRESSPWGRMVLMKVHLIDGTYELFT